MSNDLWVYLLLAVFGSLMGQLIKYLINRYAGDDWSQGQKMLGTVALLFIVAVVVVAILRSYGFLTE